MKYYVKIMNTIDFPTQEGVKIELLSALKEKIDLPLADIDEIFSKNEAMKNLSKKILDEKRREKPNLELEDAFKAKVFEIFQQNSHK